MDRDIAERSRPGIVRGGECGFSLPEFLIATLILIATSTWIFKFVIDIQKSAGYQTQTLAVQDNLRIGLRTVERYIRFAGNDPLDTDLAGVTIVSATEVRLRSDLSGSTGQGGSGQGDPDGDTNDAGEDVTIRYNADSRTLELIPNGESSQTIAESISGFQLQYLDATDAPTLEGGEVRKIRVSITCLSPNVNQQTRRDYGYQITRDIQLATRQ